MVLKAIVPIVFGAVLIGAPVAGAAEYRADELLSLDLSKAILSTKPIGPEAQFQPFSVEASRDPAVAATQPETKSADPKIEAPATVAAASSAPAVPVRIARPIVAKPPGAARTKLAHRHSNPLDAQAMDTRIQTWPCRPGSGGICNWK